MDKKETEEATKNLEQQSASSSANGKTSIEMALGAELASVAEGETLLCQALGYSDAEMMKALEAGQAMFRAGKYQRAKKVFAGLIALNDRVAIFHLHLALTERMLRNVDATHESFDRALIEAHSTPDGADFLASVRLERARWQIELGRLETAKHELEEILNADSASPEVIPNAISHAARQLYDTLTLAPQRAARNNRLRNNRRNTL